MHAFLGPAGLAACLLVASPPAGLAQTGQFGGVDSLRVFVTGVAGEVPAGLAAEVVRTHVEVLLAAAGLRVDSGQETTAPALRVGFSFRRLESGWVIGVRAEFLELSASLREYIRERARRRADPSRGAAEPDSVLGGVVRNVTTWSRFAVATCGPDAGYDTALAVVGQLVSELTDAIRADNPG